MTSRYLFRNLRHRGASKQKHSETIFKYICVLAQKSRPPPWFAVNFDLTWWRVVLIFVLFSLIPLAGGSIVTSV